MAVAVHSRRRDRKVIRYDSERAQEADQGGAGRQAESHSEEEFYFGQPEESRVSEGSGEEIHRRRAGGAPQGEESSAQDYSPSRGGEARGGNPPCGAETRGEGRSPNAIHKDPEGQGPGQAREGRGKKTRAAQERGTGEGRARADPPGGRGEQVLSRRRAARDAPRRSDRDSEGLQRGPHRRDGSRSALALRVLGGHRAQVPRARTDLRPRMGVVQDDPPRLRQIEGENRATSTSFSRARREPGISAFPPGGATRSRSAPCPPTDASSSSPYRTSWRRPPTA